MADAPPVTEQLATDAVRRHDPPIRGFASDNYAGAHPEVLAALALANGGHQIAYGEDDYTAHLQEVFRRHFGPHAEAFPVFNGTGANVIALQAITERWGAVICAETAHINIDECGAPERVGGLKLLTVATPDGKLTPELIDRQACGFDDEHRAQPQVVSITQTTELGTCYTPDEIRAICEHAHARGMTVHLDGARIANAAATAGRPAARLHHRRRASTCCPSAAPRTACCSASASSCSTRTPVRCIEVPAQDVDAAGVQDALRLRAVRGAARRRPVAAQRPARQRHGGPAGRGRTGRRGRQVPRPVQANAVFARAAPGRHANGCRSASASTFWDEPTGEVRWMCSFDTTEADVDAFTAALTEEMAAV